MLARRAAAQNSYYRALHMQSITQLLHSSFSTPFQLPPHHMYRSCMYDSHIYALFMHCSIPVPIGTGMEQVKVRRKEKF